MNEKKIYSLIIALFGLSAVLTLAWLGKKKNIVSKHHSRDYEVENYDLVEQGILVNSEH